MPCIARETHGVSPTDHAVKRLVCALSELHNDPADYDQRYSQQSTAIEFLFQHKDCEYIHKQRITTCDCHYI